MPEQAIYERQNMIKDLKIPKSASVIGLGGTGFWTSLLLAMSGVEELILVDSDIVEVSNLNRLPIEDSYVGKKKSEALKDLILKIRKHLRLEIHNIRIEKPIDCQVLRGDVFCCTDNLKSQQVICAYCKKNDLAYQRIGYDGTILNVSKTFPLSFKEDTRQGYTVTPSWVIPAVFAASAGVASRTYKEVCLMDDLGKLHIQKCSHICPKLLDDAKEEGKEYVVENIYDYLPDNYGDCSDCDRVNPDDGYGYCADCEEHYSESEIEDIKEEAKNEEYDRIIDEIERGEITDSKLREVLTKYQKGDE